MFNPALSIRHVICLLQFYPSFCGVLFQEQTQWYTTILLYLDGNYYIFLSTLSRHKQTHTFLLLHNLKLCQSHTLQAGSGMFSWFTVRFSSAAAQHTISRSLTVKINLAVNQSGDDIMQDWISSSPLVCLHKVECEGWGVCLHRQQSTCSMREHQTLTLNVWCRTLNCSYYMLAMQTRHSRQDSF